MKTQSKKTSRSVSTPVVLAAMALLTLIAGCVVTSVYPYYTEKDLVFEPALLGDWVDAGNTNVPPEVARVSRVGEKGYSVTVVGTTNPLPQDYCFFRLKGHLFLDASNTNRTFDTVPVHQVSKITLAPASYQKAELKYDWLAGLLKQNPKLLRHLILHDKPGDEGRIVLTAETADLQRFILKQVDNTNAWSDPEVFKRYP